MLWAGYVFVGTNATNNRAEYAGAEHGITATESVQDIHRLRVEGDSQVVIMQMRGEWQVVDPILQQRHVESASICEAGGATGQWA